MSQWALEYKSTNDCSVESGWIFFSNLAISTQTSSRKGFNFELNSLPPANQRCFRLRLLSTYEGSTPIWGFGMSFI